MAKFPKAIDLPYKAPGVPPEKPVQAFTVVRKEGGWVMTAYTILGGQIVSQTSSQPDLKMLATEQFKIAAWKWWTSQ